MVLIADKSNSPLIKEVYLDGSKIQFSYQKSIVVEVKFTVQYFWSKFLAEKNLSGDLPSALSGCATLSPSLNRLGVFLNVRPSIAKTERDAQQQ